MSITDQDVRQVFNGTGSQTDFTIPFDFELDANTQVLVYVLTTSGDQITATLQTEGAMQDYTLTGGDIPNGVNYTTVSFNTAPGSGEQVLLIRATPGTQANDYTNSTAIPADTHEAAIDKLTRLVQEAREEIDRCVKFRIGSQQTDIPIDEPNGGKFLQWNAAGDAIQNVDGELGSVSVPAGTGLLVKDSAATSVVRDIAGTANEIDVANGDGQAGNPTVGIADDPVLPGSGAVTVPGGTTAQQPGSPANGMFRYNSDDDQFEGYTSEGWGALAGSGNSSFIDYFSNSFLEDDSSGFSTYSDLSGTDGSFVDGTGGTPGALSIALTTTSGEVLQGTQSLKVSKAASDASGEGVAALTDVTIDLDQRGKELVFSLSHNGGSANYNGSDITVHAYDVTNSVELDIRALNYTDGQGSATILGLQTTQDFAVQTSDTTQQIRVCLHVESDSVTGSAWDLVVDRVKVQARLPLLVAPIGDWQSYSPTITGFGTPTNVEFYQRRVGDTLYVRGKFTSGTSTATEARVSIPTTSGDTSLIPTIQVCGYGAKGNNTATNTSILIEPSVGYLTFGIQGASNAGLTKANGNAFLSSGQTVSFFAAVPIANASSNIAVGAAGTFRMAPILAGGTRVTTTPTRLGEYRTRVKGTGTTASDVTPTTAPTAEDGMRIHSAYRAGAGGAGEVNEWEIFVGKNKQVKVEFYSATGRTGSINTDYVVFNSSGLRIRGINQKHYDPTTGIVLVAAYTDTATADESVGRAMTAGTQPATNPSNCYFDVIVSENVQAVGFEPQNKFQVKTLSSDITADTDPISDLGFSGLTVGKVYKLTLFGVMVGINETGRLTSTHNGNVIASVWLNSSDSNVDRLSGSQQVIFTAASSTITTAFDENGTVTLEGNGTTNETHAILEELNNTKEVSVF